MSLVLTSEQYRQTLPSQKGRTPKPTENGRYGIAGRLGAKGVPREESIHIQLCAYVRTKYPSAIFTSESSGIRLTMGQAVKAKKLRSSSKLPDFWLAEPRGIFSGLFLELKRSSEEVFRKDGTLKQDDRILGQNVILGRLREKGYKAEFACGLGNALQLVEYYMSLPISIR
jgi:hypothetical protein